VQESVSSPSFRLEASTVAEARSDYAAPSYALADAETDPPVQPITQQERIPTIDVVRGVALMGILLMSRS
jgi:hypothetical protein